MRKQKGRMERNCRRGKKANKKKGKDRRGNYINL